MPARDCPVSPASLAWNCASCSAASFPRPVFSIWPRVPECPGRCGASCAIYPCCSAIILTGCAKIICRTPIAFWTWPRRPWKKAWRDPRSSQALWLDGFAEMTPQELTLLAALAPFCEKLTLAFCLDPEQTDAETSWLSIWSGIGKTWRQCSSRFSAPPGVEVVDVAARQSVRPLRGESGFASPGGELEPAQGFFRRAFCVIARCCL